MTGIELRIKQQQEATENDPTSVPAVAFGGIR
jgi:hypothetical protein